MSFCSLLASLFTWITNESVFDQRINNIDFLIFWMTASSSWNRLFFFRIYYIVTIEFSWHFNLFWSKLTLGNNLLLTVCNFTFKLPPVHLLGFFIFSYILSQHTAWINHSHFTIEGICNPTLTEVFTEYSRTCSKLS